MLEATAERMRRLPDIGHEGLAILQRSRLALLGVGAIGGNSVLHAAQLGIPMRVVDCDRVAPENLGSAVFPADSVVLLWGFYRTPEPQRDNEANARLLRRCERLYGLLDDHLSSQKFLAGDSLTAGDIPAGTSLYRYFEMGLEVNHPPNVMAWYERLLEREAYRTNVAEPFDELFGRLEF